MTKVDVPNYEGEGEGPEYETVNSFGSDCGVDDLTAVTKAKYLAKELWLDTISMGATVACAMELSEKGALPEEASRGTLRFWLRHLQSPKKRSISSSGPFAKPRRQRQFGPQLEEIIVITVLAFIKVREGCLEEFLGVLKANVPHVMAEQGCIEYSPTVDFPSGMGVQSLDPTVVTLVERWESLPHLEAHLATPHMASYRKASKDLVAGLELKVLRQA